MTTPSDGALVLDVRELRVAVGQAQVLDGLSIRVLPHELVAVVGPNGAGKTTFLRALSRLNAWEGAVDFDGAPLPKTTVGTVEAGLIQVPERRRLFPGLTVADNLEMGTHRFGRGHRGAEADLDRVHQLFPRLAERMGQRAGTLSGGEQQQLAIGRALMARPKLLLLDEPTLGLSVGVKDVIASSVQQLKDSGITILLVEQDVSFAVRVADRMVVLEHGAVAVEGPTAQVADDPYVRQVYLGVA